MCALPAGYTLYDGIGDVILRHASMSVEENRGSSALSQRPATGKGDNKNEDGVDPRNMVGLLSVLLHVRQGLVRSLS